MASSSHLSVAFTKPPTVDLFKPLPMRPTSPTPRFQVRASLKNKVLTGLTSAAISASFVIPQVAEAAGPEVSPSLKNFLLSIVAGGAVLAAIVTAVIGVANFDPVKRT